MCYGCIKESLPRFTVLVVFPRVAECYHLIGAFYDDSESEAWSCLADICLVCSVKGFPTRVSATHGPREGKPHMFSVVFILTFSVV